MKRLNYGIIVRFFSIMQDINREYEVGWGMMAELLIYYRDHVHPTIPPDVNFEYTKLVEKLKELKAKEEAYWDKKKSEYNH